MLFSSSPFMVLRTRQRKSRFFFLFYPPRIQGLYTAHNKYSMAAADKPQDKRCTDERTQYPQAKPHVPVHPPSSAHQDCAASRYPSSSNLWLQQLKAYINGYQSLREFFTLTLSCKQNEKENEKYEKGHRALFLNLGWACFRHQYLIILFLFLLQDRDQVLLVK